MFKKILLSLFFIFSFVNADLINDKIEKNLSLAENYLWLSTDEGPHTLIDRKTQKYINLIKKDLLENNIENSQKYTDKVNNLQIQLDSIRNVNDENMYGFFPMIQFLTTDFFFKPSEQKLHRLLPIQSAKFIAINNAINSLDETLDKLEQRKIFINSIPNDNEANKIVFDLLNQKKKLFPNTDEEVEKALSDTSLFEQFKTNNLNQTILNKLSQFVENETVNFITIHRNLTEENDYYYTVSIKGINKDYNEIFSAEEYGYAIDEGHNWFEIVLVHILMLMFAILFAFYKNKKFVSQDLVLVFILFVIGRIFPWISVVSLNSIKPDSLEHYLYTTWWVLTVGAGIFLLSIIGFKTIYTKISSYIALPSLKGKGGLIGISLTAGSISFLSVSFFYFYPEFGYETISFSIFSLVMLFSGYVMGKIMDVNYKIEEKYLIIYIISIPVIFAALVHLNFDLLIILSLALSIINYLILFKNKKIFNANLDNKKFDNSNSDDTEFENLDVKDLEFKSILRKPKYQKFSYFDEAYKKASTILDDKFTQITLQGEGGAGKTRTAYVLVNQLVDDLNTKNKKILYFEAMCEKENSQNSPFSVFHNLLDSIFDVDLFGQRETDKTFDNVLNTASTILLGPVGAFLNSRNDETNQSFSKNDIFIFVKNKLIELSKNNTLILFIDDIQWVDESSLELLQYLQKYFSNENRNILFIYTVRNNNESTNVISRLELNDSIVLIENISIEEQEKILLKSLHLSKDTSKWLLEWFNSKQIEKILPSNIIDIATNLNNANALEVKDYHYELSNEFDDSNTPIPTNNLEEVNKCFEEYPNYKNLLIIAAILGKEFDIIILSKILNKNVGELIETLDDISEKTNLLYDKLEKDDYYNFRSQLIIDSIKEISKYQIKNSVSDKLSQMAMHMHENIAKGLEEFYLENKNNKFIHQIALHYFSAGKRFEDKAYEYNLLACKESQKMFDYDGALNYVKKLKGLVQKMPMEKQNEINELELLVLAEKSHVTGTDALDIAQKGISYLKSNEMVSDKLKISIVRASYEAALSKYDQDWFRNTVNLAKEYLLTSDDIFCKAEGHHFIGLSLNPRDENEKPLIKTHLEKAIELSQSCDKFLYAKIANSFAENLSYGNNEDKLKAVKLFEESLEIKENTEIKDLPGIARTCGGLGRYYYFNCPDQLDKAKEYFEKDLTVSLEIEDSRGISQMNSFLGQCALKENKYDEAIQYFNNSILQENNIFDMYVSYGGLFEALDNLERKDEILKEYSSFKEMINKFGMLNNEGIKNNIKSILMKYNTITDEINSLLYPYMK